MATKLHRGSIVKQAVLKSGIVMKFIAKKVGYSTRHMYNLFENEDLALNIVSQIGEIINYDFSKEIPELMYYTSKQLEVNEPAGEYRTDLSKNLNDCIKDRDFWKSRAYDSLEESSKLKESYFQLLFVAKEKGVDITPFKQLAGL